MKTTITIALAAALALAAPLTAQTAEELWQTLVEAEVALTIDGDVERADGLLEATAQRVGRIGDESARERVSERLVELRAMVEEAREREDDGPSLDEWLAARVGKRDRNGIDDAGATASRRLAGMLAERAFATPDLESAAIEILVEVDPGTGVDLVQTLLARRDQGDANLAARLVAAYAASSRARIGLRDGSMRWGDPRWRDLLVRLLGDAALTRSADAANGIATAVEKAIAFRVVDKPLADAIVGALERMPDQRALLIGRRYSDTPDAMAAVDQALLELGTPDDAAFAAERLALRDDSTPLAEYDEHPDVRVRREVARSLTTRRVNYNKVTLMPPYTKRQRESLVRLTADDDVTTRALATRGATGAPDALTRERWLALARDPALDVRIEVADFPFGHEWTRDVLVAVIDASGEPSVAIALDDRLGRFGQAPPDVIDARLHHASQPSASVSPGRSAGLRASLLNDVATFVDWYRSLEQPRAERYVDVATSTPVKNSWPTTGAVVSLGLTTEDVADYQRKVWRASAGARMAIDLNRLSDVARVLALDTSLPWPRRWQAIGALGTDDLGALPYAQRVALIEDIVADPASATAEAAPKNIARLIPHGHFNTILLDLWTDDGLPDHPLLEASLGIDEDAPRALEIAHRLVDLGDAISSRLRMAAIAVLAERDAAPDELIDEAILNASDWDIFERVASRASTVDDPGRFASVRALLTGDTRATDKADARARTLVSTLRYRGTRAALDLLLTAAESGPTLSVRDDALDAARQIREHLDAVDRFGAQGSTPATRDSARTELVRLLDEGSPAQRAEAARGLATLGAVEELPRLIRLLDDEHDEVRSAVREALDRLHASGDA